MNTSPAALKALKAELALLNGNPSATWTQVPITALTSLIADAERLALAEAVVEAARNTYETLRTITIDLWVGDKRITFGESIAVRPLVKALAALDAAPKEQELGRASMPKYKGCGPENTSIGDLP